VVIHRAILGSVERIIAVLTEHWAGKWPLWISPRQIIIVPLSHDQDAYCTEVCQIFHDAGFHVVADISDNSYKKKIANGQVEQYNIILVCGKQEVVNRTVNVRTRDNKQHGEKSIEACLDWLNQLRITYNKDF
jgi:threonyl-tRNA synthetase